MSRKKIIWIFMPLFVALLFLITELVFSHKAQIIPIELHWQCGQATQYPIDITNSRWNTAVLVAEDEIEASSVRVVVDGHEVDYWLVDFNSDHTSVWINLDFAINEMTKDVEIHYSDVAGLPATIDDRYKPVFDLATSSNTHWIYKEFGDDDYKRSGRWTYSQTPNPTIDGDLRYTANHFADTNPWSEMGIGLPGPWYAPRYHLDILWQVHNPCGIDSVDLQNGEKRESLAEQGRPPLDWDATLQSSRNGSSWTQEYFIPAPSVLDTWESWNRNETLSAGSTYVAIKFISEYVEGTGIEVDDVEVTIATPPTILINPTHQYLPAVLK